MPSSKASLIGKSYAIAREQYGSLGVDTAKALKHLRQVSLSLQCWQGDDVAGFEPGKGLSGGGIMATGNFPGRARNGDELRDDLGKALSLVPGSHRVNLHAIYAETDGRHVERNELAPHHFSRWVDWAKSTKRGLDFNPTFFSHPKAASGFTLSSRDESIRRFWVEHGKACRRIGAHFGKNLGSPCITNVWIPDGFKDTPADRKAPREILLRSLDDFKRGKVRVLVATDIAARGIDVDGISHVINYDLPNEPGTYVHRIGRTARAGSKGDAVSFCSAEEREILRDIEKLIRKRIPVELDHQYHSDEARSATGTDARPKPRRQSGRPPKSGAPSRSLRDIPYSSGPRRRKWKR